MLSVLIATYNYNAVILVKTLYQQLKTADIPFEIIVIDDASKSVENIKNEEINLFEFSSFKSLSKNIGRSALRNLLIKQSRYNWLLFLDADVLPTTKQFIQNYIDAIAFKKSVIVGGISYKNQKKQKNIRWKLGKKSEEKPFEIRQENPYQYFFTGNFLIEKSLINTIFFDESLTKYGYEDLVFAKELQQKKIAIHHIENPVFHLGIDENKLFIKKTKEALKNMVFLLENKKISTKDTKLVSTYKALQVFKIPQVLSLFVIVFERLAIVKSSLFFFNLFRITYLHKVFKKCL